VSEAAARSLNEVAELIRSLTAADLSRLRLIANHYARGRGIEPQDLLQEAYCRALAGDRPCPQGVHIIGFLGGVMRSVASGELDKLRRRPKLVAIARHGGEPLHSPDPIDPTPNAEEAHIGEEEKARIIKLFDSDIEGQTIVEGMMEGIEGQELRELTGLDQTAYDSKRRFVRRTINKADKGGSTQ